MDIEFNSAYELYNKVLPALKTKKREFKKRGINITENEIFENLTKMKWKDSKGLSLNEVVNDILNYEGNRVTF